MIRRDLALLVLAAPLAAQQFSDPFNYPPGTFVPGYTEQRGDWSVLPAGTVQASTAFPSQELTRDGIVDRDCCVDTVAVYDGSAQQLVYAGPLARYSPAATFFMVKLQDNATPRDGFDSYYVFYFNGTAFTFVGAGSGGAISPPTQRARVRLQVIEEAPNVRVQAYIDTDMDGRWNISNQWVTALGAGTSGHVGVAGHRNAVADDLRYFDATLYLVNRPVVGTTAQLAGRASANAPYQGLCSLGRSVGIPLGGSRAIPVDLDGLAMTSLTTPSLFAFSGFTDAAGDFRLDFHIPPIPQLAGLTVWTSAFTYSLSPFAVHDISPDVEITIVGS